MDPHPSTSNPPYYILLAQSTLSSSQAAPGSLSNNLVHPEINYHYADDPLHGLLPSQPDEHVLVLNYDADDRRDGASQQQPTAQSLSGGLSVLGLKKEEAPGAAVADAGARNDGMYIIETISNDHTSLSGSQGERKSAQAILAQFKQRNAILRQALLYPTMTQTEDHPADSAEPARTDTTNEAASQRES